MRVALQHSSPKECLGCFLLAKYKNIYLNVSFEGNHIPLYHLYEGITHLMPSHLDTYLISSSAGSALMAEWSKILPHTALTTTRVQILMWASCKWLNLGLAVVFTSTSLLK